MILVVATTIRQYGYIVIWCDCPIVCVLVLVPVPVQQVWKGVCTRLIRGLAYTPDSNNNSNINNNSTVGSNSSSSNSSVAPLPRSWLLHRGAISTNSSSSGDSDDSDDNDDNDDDDDDEEFEDVCRVCLHRDDNEVWYDEVWCGVV